MFKNIYADKRVLITGHTGFKGSWLTAWLLKMGANVAGYSIGIPSKPSHFEDMNLSSKVEHHIGDVRDYESLHDVFNSFKPEFVFHMAAQPLVRYSYENPKETFEVNMLGTLNVLECIRNMPDVVKSAVIITSDKCYDNVEWLYGYRENDKLGGEDPYSGSKGAAELIAKSYIKSFFKPPQCFTRIATARAGNVIGGGDWALDRIVPDIVRSWMENREVEIRNPLSTRPWQHVLEPLSGYLALGADLYSSSENSGEPFNFGPNSSVNKNVGELIEELKNCWADSPGWINNSYDDLRKESNLLKLSCDKANIILKWYPTFDFKQTILFTSEWYQAYKNNSKPVYNLTMEQIEEYTRVAKAKEILWAMD